MAKKIESQPHDGSRIGAAEFKTRCLKLMDRVEQTREEITITKYGKPVAKLVPFEEKPPSIFGYMKGSVTWYGDIISPIDEPWDANADA